MVTRDPETGQFVSDAQLESWSDYTRIHGNLAFTVNAADLSGGTGTRNASGNPARIMDFGEILDNDEIYHLDAMNVSTWLGFPTSATAESSGTLTYEFSKNPTFQAGGGNTAPFYSGGSTHTTDAIDISQVFGDAKDTFLTGSMAAEASLNDTTNGTGAGADYENQSVFVSLRDELGAGPVFDRDDEMYAPFELATDNISDHSISGNIQFLGYGRVETLD